MICGLLISHFFINAPGCYNIYAGTHRWIFSAHVNPWNAHVLDMEQKSVIFLYFCMISFLLGQYLPLYLYGAPRVKLSACSTNLTTLQYLCQNYSHWACIINYYCINYLGSESTLHWEKSQENFPMIFLSVCLGK